MNINFHQTYISLSNEFRSSKRSKPSIEKLYDLLYTMESIPNRSKDENLILMEIYKLLEYWQSAFDIFQKIADLNDKKQIAKLYVLKDNANNKANSFIIKDHRKTKKTNTIEKLSSTDFAIENATINVNKNEIVIFGKIINSEKLKITNSTAVDVTTYVPQIIDYIYFLGDCKKELSKSHKKYFEDSMEEVPNKEWYDEWYEDLEIFELLIIIGSNKKFYTEISIGDQYFSDHILDIEFSAQKINHMSYDG